MNFDDLRNAAKIARKFAYAPYSGFCVGAALLTKSGAVYTGCNVENAAYPLCTCAERTALCKAVSEGASEFVAIAIIGGKGEDCDSPCFPCGACRQMLAELCSPSLSVVLTDGIYPLRDLLPHSFSLK